MPRQLRPVLLRRVLTPAIRVVDQAVKQGGISAQIPMPELRRAAESFVRLELEIVKPRLVIALGKRPALVLQSLGIDAVAVPHPAARIGGAEVHVDAWTEALRSRGLAAEYIEATEPLMMRVFEAAIAGDGQADAEVRVRAVLSPAVLDALGMTAVQRDAFVAQVSGSWFTHFLRYDAHQVLSRIDVPVLALGGTLDLQVPSVEHLPAMGSALAHNGDVTVVELPGLNHFFQTARTGAPSEYAELPETFAPAAMDRIARWITDRFCEVPEASDGQRAARSCGP